MYQMEVIQNFLHCQQSTDFLQRKNIFIFEIMKKEYVRLYLKGISGQGNIYNFNFSFTRKHFPMYL